MEILVASEAGTLHALALDDDLAPTRTQRLDRSEFAAFAASVEPEQPRWVWADTAALYPELLRDDVRVQRCLDLRLCHVILRHAAPGSFEGDDLWDSPVLAEADPTPSLLDDLEDMARLGDVGPEELLAERIRQRDALGAVADPGRVRFLLAAESAGALIAAEIAHDGLPWDLEAHDRILTDVLGPRPRPGMRPKRLEELAGIIQERLSAPRLNPDSPVDLLRTLRRAGLDVKSTSKWELQELDHPVVEPLLEYKRLARLLSANGWTWMDSWVRPGTQDRRGRFFPDYVPGGVVTGRWATSGGGALQLPKQIRAAVRADPGWKLVVADVAQIEPRVLAAMSRDEALAAASRGTDLYQGLVDAGIVDTRAHAKVAMLGALYGATTGEAGHLMPRLLRAYPRATGLVEDAARTGERGGVVRTWLGRTSPPPSATWREVQGLATQPDAGESAERRARQQARDWGRFTRNFVVQGTAAEWALVWMAEIRRRLTAMTNGADRPHLVYFLHDEVIVHSPADLVDDVATAIRDASAEAGRLLFTGFGVEFPLDVAIVEHYGEAE
ncbi:bifunctional 3'-5' exonuclease/DNA polymerase [Occultella aeris]|uniref:DNA-directed DNA polymerase n=1 Tax=Occultella aeris TaxID=2761496 RepID=A0A7M4DNG0_9MICO|nr:DNA polymerase I, thermostable [Occultella aeris]